MKIIVLEKCQINGAPAKPGDVLQVEEAVAVNLEAHGYAKFAFHMPDRTTNVEAEAPKAKHAEHKAPAHNIQHPHAKSHRA